MSRASELMDSRKFMAALGKLVYECTRNADNHSEIPPFATAVDVQPEKVAEALQAVLDMAMPAEYEYKAAPIGVSMLPTAPSLTLTKKPSGIKVGFDQAAADMQAKQELEAGIYKGQRHPRGIKALIPVPELADHGQTKKAEAMIQLRDKFKFEKLKRKRRTKAEMAAARAPKAKPFNYDTATEAQIAAELDRMQATQPTQAEVLGDIVTKIIKPQFNSVAPAWDGYKHFIINLERPDGTSITAKGEAWKAALKLAGVPFGLLEIGSTNIEKKQIDVMIR